MFQVAITGKLNEKLPLVAPLVPHLLKKTAGLNQSGSMPG